MSKPKKAQITFGKFQNVDMRVARIVSAPMAEGTAKPCRVITLDVGHLGSMTSIGQFALVTEENLVNRHVVICCNLGTRAMGPYVSEALVMGAPHPDSPADQAQATPLYIDDRTVPGDEIF